MSELENTLPEQKPCTSFHPAARRLEATINRLRAQGVPVDVTVSESEVFNTTSLHYFVVVRESRVRRPGSLGELYASSHYLSFFVRLAHAGSGRRTAGRLHSAVSYGVRDKRTHKSLGSFERWVGIVCANPYVSDTSKACPAADFHI